MGWLVVKQKANVYVYVICIGLLFVVITDNASYIMYRVRQKKVIPCRILQIFKQPL